ncbi:hypothetical protein [Micromonospora endophytica]|uniref:Uncharacterized protein n=1 Tax=Micromonospora endophytica TaxID=515350 RepID=A0A2W2CJ34_9ACTN|nr:hypothetical protein [Micromonospora endophytica]PZF99415.1 hypothetical protein C1I93_06025 [Micromonospora endophytica]RIW42876.1 hypothetical protein D3H59_21870 [Micromonospora endophytica]BCJ61606.1 hypothetical protein Jiend_50280 [Micromonospora endophytica]
MRDGQTVTVRALTAMPGVADRQVRHGVEWTPQLAKLVDAGRYEVLDSGEPPAGPLAAIEDAPSGPAADDGDEPPAGDGEPLPARRSRRR